MRPIEMGKLILIIGIDVAGLLYDISAWGLGMQ